MSMETHQHHLVVECCHYLWHIYAAKMMNDEQSVKKISGLSHSVTVCGTLTGFSYLRFPLCSCLCAQVQQLCGSPSRRSAASVVPHSRESVVFKPDARSLPDSLAARRR